MLFCHFEIETFQLALIFVYFQVIGQGNRVSVQTTINCFSNVLLKADWLHPEVNLSLEKPSQLDP